ncbi:MAG TPA: 3-oxoacyl-[acyl-carrier-protein] synthase III C-terminal domain-containing protein [Kofleriaceae bacterium]|nr:3-oxoacyl-[acyl-carrier-protein] synthase III C-terminal domain-containing protein [Kofleriaceae bacterium]
MTLATAAAGGVGILGVGTSLPPEVRRNDWWPADVIDRWTRGQARALESLRARPPAEEASRKVADAMLELGGDPFGGVVERRVLAADRTSTDLEAEAAAAAIAHAGLTAADIDVLLVHTAVPDYLLSNTACVLHERLGLPATCLAFEVQASAYSFLAQLELARPLVAGGRARHALLVQSSAVTRLLDPGDPFSARVGDAAGAVVLGPVAADRGVLAASHRTDGRRPRTLIATHPGGRWYDGASQLCVPDVEGAFRMFLETVGQARTVIDEALARAGRAPGEVDFFAVHQGTAWLRRLVQEHVGLGHARSVDLFGHIGYVFAASIPLVLDAALRGGALRDGDLVVVMGGGTGMTYGAAVLRWGRGDA